MKKYIDKSCQSSVVSLCDNLINGNYEESTPTFQHISHRLIFLLGWMHRIQRIENWHLTCACP